MLTRHMGGVGPRRKYRVTQNGRNLVPQSGKREGIHPERDLGQKFYFKQKYGVSMYLNSYQNAYAIIPIIVYNKQSCLGCVFQKS